MKFIKFTQTSQTLDCSIRVNGGGHFGNAIYGQCTMIKHREVISKARQKSKLVEHICREQSIWNERGNKMNKIMALAPNGFPSCLYPS